MHVGQRHVTDRYLRGSPLSSNLSSMTRPLLLLLVLLLARSVEAQSVTIKPIPLMTICPGDSFTVSYTVEGDFDPKNVFSVQLSSADGSFSNFTSIGMKRSNVSGDIRVAIS